MADQAQPITYQEIRFIIEPAATQVYVLCATEDAQFANIVGWHHKSFLPSKTVDKILEDLFRRDNCTLWPMGKPPATEE